MKLTAGQWVELLSKDYPVSRERVIVVCKSGKTLRIRKELWQEYFVGFNGIGFMRARGIELVPAEKGGAKAELPDWVVQRLGCAPEDALCITQKANKFYLKKLQLVERPSSIPGCVVIDELNADVVTRTYSPCSDPDKITNAGLKKLLGEMGRFRHDPVAPFKDMKGRIGLLARKEFLGGWTKADRQAVRDYRDQIVSDQQDNGSWGHSVAETAFRVIRLKELGCTMKYSPLARATEWVLTAGEPPGLPGMFMFDNKTLQQFSNWKRKHTGKDRAAYYPARHEVGTFVDNRDILGVSNSFCELKMTWATAIATEALLRCGLAEYPRVIKTINTLLALRSGYRWCGCGYFAADRNIVASTRPVDFNGTPVSIRNPKPGHVWKLDWPMGKNDFRHIAHGEQYESRTVGSGQTLLVRKPDKGTGDCSFIVHRSLSWHPSYRGSNLETLAALECEFRQGWDGTWTGNTWSFIFTLLGRLSCPLAGFVVLRSVPLLIRRQGTDGLWDEGPDVAKQGWALSRGPLPSPTKQETTFAILSALKRFRFLDALWPRKNQF